MMTRGLQIGILLLMFSPLWGQNAQRITANLKVSEGEKMACADQYAGTIQLGDINAQSARIDLQDTTFLCYQDMFQILHEGNANLTGDPDPSTTPGIGYLWYDCTPTIPGTNLSTIRLDACLIATPPPTNDLWAFVDDINGDAKFSNGNNILGGNLTTVPDFFNGGQPFQAWFAPVTFDDAASLAFENSMSGEQGPCVNVNTNEAFSVVYLNPIEITNKNIIDLSGNPFVAEFEIEGGLPEFNGTNYTNIQIIKSTNTFVKGTVLNTPYTDGDIVSFTVPEEGEYIITVEDGVSCGASEIFLISQDNDGILFDIGDINGTSGDVVCVPFIVENFDSIEVFQFTINFDPNLLSYDSFSDIRLIGFDISAVNLDNVDKGELRIIWIDPNLFEADGVSVADGEKLWDVCFSLKGTCNETCANVTITGSPLNIEVQNANSVLLETIIDPGQICITPGSALTICPTSCSSVAGLMQGSLSFSITGGTPPYNYTGDIPPGVMNMDGETVTVSSLNPGNYIINVTDNSGTMTSVTITVRDSPTLSIDSIFVRDPRCFGYADGRIRIVEVSGGNESEAYSYQWSNFLFNVTQLTDLPQGTYTVTVTDADGCTDEDMVILEANPLDPGVIVVDPATCDGVFDGLIRVRPTGGNPQNGALYNYNVQWEDANENIIVVSGIGVQRTINNVGGTVNIQIGDANGCLEESSYDIPVAKELSVQAFAQDILCFGENSGQIDVTAISQGDPLTDPVQFTLLDTFMTVIETAVASSDNHIFTGLALDSYLIEMMDGDGCTADTIVNIGEPTELLLDFATSGLECSGTGSDGKILISIEGGVGPYDILWEGGETIDSIENLNDGIYKVTVTDANMCMDSLEVDLTANGNLVLANAMLEQNPCNGDMAGSITLTVQSNSTDIDYMWSNGGTTETIDMLGEGEYRVTITNDFGCEILDTFNITEPSKMNLGFSSSGLDCSGTGSDGKILISIEGGVGPYDILWEGGETIDSIENISTGIYKVTVTDANMCMDSLAVDLTARGNLVLANAMLEQNSCNGDLAGSITLTVQSNSTDIDYMWSNGGTTETINMLGEGEYRVTITNDFGCEILDTFNITEPSKMNIGFSTSGLDCSGTGSDGKILISIEGGVGPYDILWEGGETIDSIENISTGIYKVTVTDANMCMDSLAVDLTARGNLVLANAMLEQNSCNGDMAGSITLTVQSNSTDIDYMWSNGDTTETIDMLGEGEYRVTITNDFGCEILDTFNITEPSKMNIGFSTSGLDCSGTGSDGKILISIDGGVGPYDILWEGGETIDSIENIGNGVYKVTVTDANMCMDSLAIDLTAGGNLVLANAMLEHNICNGDMAGSITLTVQTNSTAIDYMWSNGDATSSISMLDGGEYRVTISNDQGCILLDTFTINEPMPLSLTVNPDEPTCPGENGNLSIIVEGGIGDYTYDWDHPNDVMGATLPGIPAGNYTVTVMDENNCPLTRSIALNDPDNILVNLDPSTIEGISCNGENTGQATAIPSGGTIMSGVYNFEWSSGETSTAAVGNAIMLESGQQWLLVNDGLCSTDSIFFTVPVADSIKLADDMNVIKNPSCNGISDGTATVVGTGGDGNFSYDWINDGQTGPTAIDLSPGVHVVEITDGQGCMALDSILLMEPEAIGVSINILDNVRCSDSEDGILEALVVGGNSGDFMYEWSGSALDSSIVHEIVSGIQTVTVTDSEGCSSTAETELIAPPPVVASIDNIPTPDCFGDRVCLGVDNASGGSNTGFTFQVNRGPRIAIDTCVSLLPGPYTITVLDDKGCADEFDIEIESAPEFSVGLVGEQNINLGDSTTITAMINGTTIIDSVFWNPIEDLQCFSADCISVQAKPTGTTSYQVLVTDMNGCSASDEITIEVNLNRNVFIPNTFSPRSFDFENSELRIYAGTGVSSIDYFRIYDRWGNMIHETENLIPSKFGSEGWDGKFNGKRVNPGVYVYFSKINFADGSSLVYKGSVTVL